MLRSLTFMPNGTGAFSSYHQENVNRQRIDFCTVLERKQPFLFKLLSVCYVTLPPALPVYAASAAALRIAIQIYYNEYYGFTGLGGVEVAVYHCTAHFFYLLFLPFYFGIPAVNNSLHGRRYCKMQTYICCFEQNKYFLCKWVNDACFFGKIDRNESPYRQTER